MLALEPALANRHVLVLAQPPPDAQDSFWLRVHDLAVARLAPTGACVSIIAPARSASLLALPHPGLAAAVKSGLVGWLNRSPDPASVGSNCSDWANDGHSDVSSAHLDDVPAPHHAMVVAIDYRCLLARAPESSSASPAASTPAASSPMTASPSGLNVPEWIVRLAARARDRRVWLSVPACPASPCASLAKSLSDFTLPAMDWSLPSAASHAPIAQSIAQPTTQPTTQPIAQPPLVSSRGTLYLVGAGPGSPDLLTLRAHTILHTADLIISDRLIAPAILATLPPSRLRFTRKVCGRAREAQDEIFSWLLSALSAGLSVVRLKSGDPFMFGRGGEEANVVRRAGYPVHLVPGVSSALAAPGAAGIPITHRGVADSVYIATGQTERGGIPTSIPVFAHGRTCVFLMAMGNVRVLVDRLVGDLEYPPHTPAAVVERGTYADQRVVWGTIATIAHMIETHAIASHATLVVGDVVHALDVDGEHAKAGMLDWPSTATAATSAPGRTGRLLSRNAPCFLFNPDHQWTAAGPAAKALMHHDHGSSDDSDSSTADHASDTLSDNDDSTLVADTPHNLHEIAKPIESAAQQLPPTLEWALLPILSL